MSQSKETDHEASAVTTLNAARLQTVHSDKDGGETKWPILGYTKGHPMETWFVR